MAIDPQTTEFPKQKKRVLPIKGWKNLWFRNDGVARNGKRIYPTEEAAKKIADTFDRKKFPHVVYAIQFPWRGQ